MKNLKLILGLVIFIIFGNNVRLIAQNNDIADLKAEDYLQIQLPPLSVLIENSKKSSNVRYFETKQKANESMMKTEKRDWLKYIKIVGGYQYGVMADNSSLANQNIPQVFQVSSSKQNWYNVGVSLSIPFDDVFDRGNRLHRRKLEMEATQIEVEKWHDEQKIRIISAYSNALELLTVIKAKTEAMTLADAQYKIAENDFINGRINAAALSVSKNIQTDALVNYENTKSALNTVLLQLEVLSNTQIIK